MTSGIAVTGRRQKNTSLVPTITGSGFRARNVAAIFGLLTSAAMAALLGFVVSTRVTPEVRPGLTTAALSAIASNERCVVDLGVIACGDRVFTRLKLRNTLGTQIEIARFFASCPCVRVESFPRRISPRDTSEVFVGIDLSHDPAFTGGLSPELEFVDASGVVHYRFTLNVVVTNDRVRRANIQCDEEAVKQ